MFRRADGLADVVPSGFLPDFADRSTTFRSYAQGPQIALPMPQDILAASGARACTDLERVSLLLHLAAGPLRGKLDIDWNLEVPPIGFAAQSFRRGTASGGGLYPTQFYPVIPPGQGLPAGVYHYAAGRHALVPLRLGRWDHRIAAAVDPKGRRSRGGPYLLIASDFWMNCFKYHNLGYHICCQDGGAMLATLHLAAECFGQRSHSALCFDDDILNGLIGADGENESVLAVVDLGQADAHAMAEEHGETALVAPVPRPWQRSRHVAVAPQIPVLNRLAMQMPANWTDLGRDGDFPAGGAPSAPPLSRAALVEALMRRQSAWGSMNGGTPIPEPSLRALLRVIGRQTTGPGRRNGEALPQRCLELYLLANSVGGLAAGAYRWDAAGERLEAIAGTPLDSLQILYQMENYNLDETGCILFLTGDLDSALRRFGPRGYRILNAHIGMQAQLAYVAAAHEGLDCGIALGVRAQTAKRVFALAEGREVFLAAFLGTAKPPCQLFDYRLMAGAGAMP